MLQEGPDTCGHDPMGVMVQFTGAHLFSHTASHTGSLHAQEQVGTTVAHVKPMKRRKRTRMCNEEHIDMVYIYHSFTQSWLASS